MPASIRFYSSIVLLFILNIARAQAISGSDVVVSISPLEALVAGVMHGVAQPTLLLNSSQSPHHASLRPSQLRELNQAKLVFWIGPQMETFLPDVLNNLKPGIKTIALMQNPTLIRLPLRNTRDTVAHGRDRVLDPHIWLSTHNASIMVNQIAASLSALDPEHLGIYMDNAHRMQMKMKVLHKKIAAELKHGGTYVSYHDAFQYFENEFDLKHVGSVTQDEELPPSAQRVRELRQHILKDHVHCVVYDAPFRPALISTLLRNTSAHATELDALGVLQKNDRRSWFILMQDIGEGFKRCLGTQSHKN